MIQFSLNYQNLVMVNDFNSFYMLGRRLNRKFFSIKISINLMDTTAELLSTAIEAAFLHTNTKMEKIKSAFQT